jgi:hypothetical protein
MKPEPHPCPKKSGPTHLYWESSKKQGPAFRDRRQYCRSLGLKNGIIFWHSTLFCRNKSFLKTFGLTPLFILFNTQVVTVFMKFAPGDVVDEVVHLGRERQRVQDGDNALSQGG